AKAAGDLPLFAKIPKDGLRGSAAGQMIRPAGVAVDQSSGHVFVADTGNSRVSEFTAWGVFVKAWGWGVADGTSNALQGCGPRATPPSAACFQGKKGSGIGQMFSPISVAVDSLGDVYVFEKHVNTEDGEPGPDSIRVQKFDPEGNFLFMLGGS